MFRHILVFLTLSLCVLCELINRNEGSSCSWKQAIGVCVSIYRCESATLFLKTREYPPICTFQGKDPVICCTDCTIVEDVRNVTFNPNAGILLLTGQKANDKCVNFVDKLDYDCKINTRANYSRTLDPDLSCYNIEAITETIPIPLPPPRESYLALLGYGPDINTADWLCAGTIISEKFILTAAHCLYNDKQVQVKYVAVGINKRTDSPSQWLKYNVKRIIAHPEYHPPSKYNDIALLETEKTISFNTDVLPACLPLSSEADEFAEATGWGALGHRQGLSDVLQTVLLQRYDAEKCSQLYPKHRHLREGYNHSSQMCYGDTLEAKDTCEGDSGGPLQTANVFLPCAYTVLGVTSYGRQCGVSAGSGMYTRVYHYVPWIESIVWP